CMTRRTPRSTLFPYTTLFRSQVTPLERRRNVAAGFEDGAHDLAVRGWVVQIDRKAADCHALERQRSRGGIVFPAAFRFRTSRERSEEHTSELQSLTNLVCRLL